MIECLFNIGIIKIVSVGIGDIEINVLGIFVFNRIKVVIDYYCL